MKIEFKCPHCGWRFNANQTPDGKTPKHLHDGKSECPGVGTKPRGVKDGRPLGKDVQGTKGA